MDEKWLIWSEDQDESDAKTLTPTFLDTLDYLVRSHVEADYKKDFWEVDEKEFFLKNLASGEIKKVHGSTDIRVVVNARIES